MKTLYLLRHAKSSWDDAGLEDFERPLNERGINAAIAGHFGVPVIMVSGDDAAVEETRTVVGDVEGAVVKWNYGFHSARTLTPAAATALIDMGSIRSDNPGLRKIPPPFNLVIHRSVEIGAGPL